MANEEPGRIGAMIASQGWAALSGRQVRALTGIVHGPEWDAFGRSWSALGDDRYMADGGRYRRRRHAVLALTDGEVRTLPPRPHYQSRDYNSLNGGIERWFAQVQPEVLGSETFRTLLALCRDVFALADVPCEIEVHQFRIEAGETPGYPTPEGMHRDGVDRVGVFLIERYNVEAGSTRIAIDGEKDMTEFTLTNPLDAVFIDDRRVRHGVTPISSLLPGREAHRDVLVLTFRFAGKGQGSMETRIRGVLSGRVAPFGPMGEPSGYAKAIRTDRVEVTLLGLEGDEQADLVHHGGVDKAVHHYAIDHYPAWIAERPGLTAAFSEPGAFGENISTLGWREETVCIGDRFRMGTALVEISQGRQPCWKLGHRFGDPAMVDRVVKTGRCGWYYRVIEPGMVAAGDIIRLVERCHPDWTVARTFRILIGKAPTRRDDIAELAGLPQLSASWRARCHAMLG